MLSSLVLEINLKREHFRRDPVPLALPVAPAVVRSTRRRWKHKHGRLPYPEAYREGKVRHRLPVRKLPLVSHCPNSTRLSFLISILARPVEVVNDLGHGFTRGPES